MANSIALVTAFRETADLIYKEASKTAFLDSLIERNDHTAASEIKIFKLSTVGMGNYSRSTGYAAGDVTATWETIKLLYERGRQFSVDNMDNEETFGMTFGRLVGEYVRTNVIPELDAARFARWASTSGVQSLSGALSTASNVLKAVDDAANALDNYEVPMEGRVLFISSAIHRLLYASVNRTLDNQNEFNRTLRALDDMNIVVVPQTRFYSSVTLDAGATSIAGGYAKTSGASNINFILMHPSAVWQAVKLDNIKIFSPDQNQVSDSWLCQHRVYHDGGVYDNKVKGVYVHTATGDDSE